MNSIEKLKKIQDIKRRKVEEEQYEEMIEDFENEDGYRNLPSVSDSDDWFGDGGDEF